ncbi:MAG: phosphate ABC transporter permease subunit PstC [Litorimonas sp.]
MKARFSTLSARSKNSALKTYVSASCLVSAGLVLLIFGLMLVQSFPALSEAGGTLFTTRWNPTDNQYGMLPMLYGTLVVMLIAMVFAVPIGILAAIYIAETRSEKLRRLTRSALEILAGVPSIVYGLIGIAYVSVWVANGLSLQTGRLILTAGLILAIMILPTILSLTTDAILNVPRDVRENAQALGLYRYEVFKDAIWPVAKADIAGAALLALGRALGETMAVMLVIGSIDRLPQPLYNVLSSGQTITSKLGREVGESAFGSTHFSALVLMSLILVSITILLTAASQHFFRAGRHV